MGRRTARLFGVRKDTMSLAVLSISLAVAGCGGGVEYCETNSITEDYAPGVVFVDDPVVDLPADPATIESAAVRGDRLVLALAYEGGDGPHAFALSTTGVFRDADPPEADVYLQHDRQGDEGREVVREDRAFDIWGLKAAYLRAYPDGTRLLLRLYAPGASQPSKTVSVYKF
jgi:hypothetical protein